MNVFNLFAKLTLDDSSYKKNIEETKGKNAEFETSTKKMSLGAKIGWAAVGAAVIGITSKIKDLALETINYADSFSDLAAKLSMSTDSVQEMNYIAGQLGTNLDTLTNTMAVMYNKAKEGDDAFAKIGVSVKDANGEIKSMDALFYETVGAMNAIESDSERTAAMLDVFGRSALQIGEVLNTDVDTLKAMGKEAHNLGIVISEDSIQKASDFNDKMDEFKLRGKGILVEMLLGEGGEELDAKFDKFIDDFIVGFENVFPKFVNFAIKLLQKLIISIAKMLPSLIPTLINAILDIDWLSVGLSIGEAILNGIWEILKRGLGALIGYGWLWGGETSTPADMSYTASDVVGGVVNETKKSTQVDLNVNVSGDTAISQANAETIAETLLPYIDKGLGRV